MSDEDVTPPAARLLLDFVNTYEPQTGHEAWGSAEHLRLWSEEQGLLPAGARLQAADLARAVAVREGLRAVLVGHAGDDPADPAVLAGLNRALAEVPVRLAFTGEGHHLAPAGGAPLDQALARVLDAVRQCAEAHAFTRLKACARHTCHWAFYDASRNQSRRWCSMAGCGNHVKMRRAYAARTTRRRAADPAPGAPAPR